jgi:hypothetical protein
VFVGGGVQHHFDAMIRHDRPGCPRIGDGAQHWHDFGMTNVAAFTQFAVDVVKCHFADFEQNQLARGIGQQLPTKLCANRAACPRDQNGPARIGGDAVRRHFFDRFATQKLPGFDRS